MVKSAIGVPTEILGNATEIRGLQKFGPTRQPNQLPTTESVYLLHRRFQSSVYFRLQAEGREASESVVNMKVWCEMPGL
jgi:hypothetical protein